MRKITVISLTALFTNDFRGQDEIRIDCHVDGIAQSPIKRKLSRGQSWNIDQDYVIRDSLRVQLIEEDKGENFNFIQSIFDDPADDFLGSISISSIARPNAMSVAAFSPNMSRFGGTGYGYYLLAYRIAPVFTLSASVGQSGANQPSDVKALKQRLVELGFNWLSVDTQINSETIRAIKLFQSIINGRQTVQGDGRVDVPGLTYSWLKAINAPYWELMPAGSSSEGFLNYELIDTNDNHDYGTDWLTNTIQRTGRLYRNTYLASNSQAALVAINDVSQPQGGDTPDHSGHETGLGCDLRLPRTNGQSGGGITWNSPLYDQAAMRSMLQAIKDQPLWSRTFFNDTELISEGLCVSQPGHDDHAHFEIKPPTRID